MSKKRLLYPLPLFDEASLISVLEQHGWSSSHAVNIYHRLLRSPLFFQPPSSYPEPEDSLIQRHNALWDLIRSMPNAPPALVDVLKEKFTIESSRVVVAKTSGDGSTTKLLIELQDGQEIEAVIMRHREREVPHTELHEEETKEESKEHDSNADAASESSRTSGNSHSGYHSHSRAITGGVGRVTLCVSSQVGCQMACSFCATGTMGLKANLMSGEILEQLIFANRIAKVRNIVYMGMGEPLDNYAAVLTSMRSMIDNKRFGLSPLKITISTVGVIPRIKQLITDAPYVQLAFSLHAPTQALRLQIVPTAAAYSLDKLISTIDLFITETGKTTQHRKRVLIEYVLLKDVNCSDEIAHQLGALLTGKNVLVNLIPYNPTNVIAQYEAPPIEAVNSFAAILRGEEYKLFTTVRVEMGQDISGACGQLALENRGIQGEKKKNGEKESCSSNSSNGSGKSESGSGSGGKDIEDVLSRKKRGGQSAAVNGEESASAKQLARVKARIAAKKAAKKAAAVKEKNIEANGGVVKEEEKSGEEKKCVTSSFGYSAMLGMVAVASVPLLAYYLIHTLRTGNRG